MDWTQRLQELLQGFAVPGTSISGAPAGGAPMPSLSPLDPGAGAALARAGGAFATPGVSGAPSQASPASLALNNAFERVQAQNAWKGKSDAMNNAFNSLRAFGQSLGGLDLTPLNDIPRNTPPIILPMNNQNPGSVALMALMQKIAGG